MQRLLTMHQEQKTKWRKYYRSTKLKSLEKEYNEMEIKCAELQRQNDSAEGLRNALELKAEDNDKNDVLIKERLTQADQKEDELKKKEEKLNKKENELNNREEKLSRQENNIQRAESSQNAGNSIQLTATKTPEERAEEIVKNSGISRFDGNFNS